MNTTVYARLGHTRAFDETHRLSPKHPHRLTPEELAVLTCTILRLLPERVASIAVMPNEVGAFVHFTDRLTPSEKLKADAVYGNLLLDFADRWVR